MTYAKKSLGQNFLHDTAVLKDILDAGELKTTDRVIEIGPGEGFLTRALLSKVAHLTAIELDHDLIPWLKMDFGKDPKFELVEGDALKFSPSETPYKLIANIPYYITSPLLNHFLLEQFLNGHPPELMVVMVQREVAEKIVDPRKHSVLSLEVQLFAEAELVRIVPPTSFKPRPAVDSAVLKIRPLKEPRLKGDLKRLLWLMKMSFAQKRKKLSNNLSSLLKLSNAETKAFFESLKISPDVRAEDLTFEEWDRLFNGLSSVLDSSSR
jgi:16S rRNA (adenine1518-N6/adenine1519-N6)-dimethyltransferase